MSLVVLVQNTSTRSPLLSTWLGNSKYLSIRLASLASFQPFKFTSEPETLVISIQSE